MRDHAFDVLGLSSLISMIRQGNEASLRVAKKIGMWRELERSNTAYWQYRIDYGAAA